MKLQSVTKEETAYDKYIKFEYEGQDYCVLLHWDKHDGYDITFTEVEKTYNTINDPDWAINWEDNNDQSLASVLDALSDETLEESYL